MSFKSLLSSLCTIQSVATTVNSLGEVRRTYTAGTQVNCRLNPLRSGEADQSRRSAVTRGMRLYLEPGANITESHRVQSGGKTFNVTAVDDMFSRHLEVDMERVE